jgi:hypothetical protein
VIAHRGVRYWTTNDLAGSLISRGLIASSGSKRECLRRTRRWAESVDLRPVATTKMGGLLWPEDATLVILEHAGATV